MSRGASKLTCEPNSDEGLVALAAALPALTELHELQCDYNPAATARGWVALFGALPSLPALEQLELDGCTGMGSEGAAALAAALPQCPRLRRAFVRDCGLDQHAQGVVLAAQARCARSEPAHSLTIKFVWGRWEYPGER